MNIHISAESWRRDDFWPFCAKTINWGASVLFLIYHISLKIVTNFDKGKNETLYFLSSYSYIDILLWEKPKASNAYYLFKFNYWPVINQKLKVTDFYRTCGCWVLFAWWIQLCAVNVEVVRYDFPQFFLCSWHTSTQYWKKSSPE